MRAAELTASDWRRLIAAFVAQLLTAFLLRTISLGTLRKVAAGSRTWVRLVLRGPEERVVWAIEASGRRLAGASTCLIRAIVADLALGSRHQPLRLTIGIRHVPGEPLHAHAWLMDRDRILVGGPEVEEYVPLVTWVSRFA